MCHIIIAAKKGGLGRELAEKVVAGTYLAFDKNPHMEGIYVSEHNKVYKSIDKMRLFDKIKEIARSEIVVYHARYSTSGKGFNNCQPWIDSGKVMVHNGVFSIANHHDKDKSDSILVFEKLGPQLKAQKPFVDAFKETLDEMTGFTTGSYSVGVYDPRSRTLDYIKNASTGMEYYEFDGGFVMSTKSLYIFNDMFGRSATLKADRHYIAKLDEDFSLIDTGEMIQVEHKRETYSSVYGDSWWKSSYGSKADTLWDDTRHLQPVGSCGTNDCTDRADNRDHYKAWTEGSWNTRFRRPNYYY